VRLVVFGMPGCGHCEEYVPRVAAARDRIALERAAFRQPPPQVLFVDASRPENVELANRYIGPEVPATVLLDDGGRVVWRAVGALRNDWVLWLVAQTA